MYAISCAIAGLVLIAGSWAIQASGPAALIVAAPAFLLFAHWLLKRLGYKDGIFDEAA